MSDPGSLKGSDNLLAPRDSHFLVSAQHVFLPITKRGKVEFNPVIYNYQSQPGSPAVLTLLITREGTSVTIVENKSGDQSYQGWGQQLYFNNKGPAHRLHRGAQRAASRRASTAAWFAQR